MWNKVPGKRHQPFQRIQFKWDSVMFFRSPLPLSTYTPHCFIEASFQNVYDFTRLFAFPYNSQLLCAINAKCSAFSGRCLLLLMRLEFFSFFSVFFLSTLATHYDHCLSSLLPSFHLQRGYNNTLPFLFGGLRFYTPYRYEEYCVSVRSKNCGECVFVFLLARLHNI